MVATRLPSSQTAARPRFGRFVGTMAKSVPPVAVSSTVA
jgi:hypothetical protein